MIRMISMPLITEPKFTPSDHSSSNVGKII